MTAPPPSEQRLHALDAVRGFALLLGVAFHAAFSFMPGWPPGLWAMNDVSTSAFLGDAAFVTHIFRMSLFFFIAGYFGRLLYQKLGARGFFVNRATRILIPLVCGWVILFPIIGFVWTTGLTKVFHGAPPPMPQMPKEAGAFPLFHLWFLYVLALLYVVVIGLRALIARFDRHQALRCLATAATEGAINTGAAAFTLGIPLALCLAKLPMWFYWTGIPTPDQSLIPQAASSVGFGTAFVFGWIVHRSPVALAIMAKRWFMHLGVAVLATGVLVAMLHRHPVAEPGFTKNAFAYLFGVAAWSWVLGLTGAALRFLSHYSPARRYLADSSYWIYLAHLPVVVAFQIWVGQWPLGWQVKYPIVLLGSFAVLFTSYHLLVRPTLIGQLLNGRRVALRNRQPSRPAVSAPVAATRQESSAIASLRSVTKRYDKVTALGDLTLEIRPGELLAVLGPNGAGKSTAISMLLGLGEPDAGEARLFGGSPQDVDRRLGLGVMMQDIDLVKELRVREHIELASSYYVNPRGVDETLRIAGIASIAERAYGKLSGGQKRQVQFALAICGRPRILFLDEPTVGLDIRAREALWESVRAMLKQGCSVVLTTHYLEEAEALATRIAVVTRGRLISTGSVAEMRALVSRREIQCETSLSPDIVRSWTGVATVREERGRLRIGAADAEGIVRRLLAADPALRRLEVREAGLLEAFTELTREAA